MRGPVRELARVDALHRDALLDRAHMHAQIAADTFGVHHFKMPDAIFFFHDRLVSGVFARDMAQTALDADRKSTRLNSSHTEQSRMPSSA